MRCYNFSEVECIILELQKGAERLQCSAGFMNKIEEKSNTAFLQPNHLLDWSPEEPLF